MIDYSFVKASLERIAKAEERQATALEVIAGVVDEIYKEQQQEEVERMRTVSSRDVVRQPPPRVPRPQAKL